MMIGVIEYSSNMVVKEKMEIDTDHYSELQGLNEADALDYIKKWAVRMKPTPEGESWASCLHDELMEMDVIRDKEYNYSTDIYND